MSNWCIDDCNSTSFWQDFLILCSNRKDKPFNRINLMTNSCLPRYTVTAQRSENCIALGIFTRKEGLFKWQYPEVDILYQHLTYVEAKRLMKFFLNTITEKGIYKYE